MNGTTNNGQQHSKTLSEIEAFDALFPELVDALTKDGINDPETSQALTWFRKVLEYNVPFGKKNRGLSVVESYRRLVPEPTEENLKIARVLGWCVEFLQAYFVLGDDIMDKAVTRRGKPCWYKNENVGMIAINDSFFLYACVFKLLKIYVRDRPYYLDVLNLFLETNAQTVIGECLDLMSAPPEGEVDFTHFTTSQHAGIAKYKTSFYSVYLSVALAMHMAGITDEESQRNARTISLSMGNFLNVQDDYLDCYGAPEVIGKIGQDIEENRCGWLIVTALGMASAKQKDILKANYGRWDNECVQKVKDVYKELDLEVIYQKYEENWYQELMSNVSTLGGNLPKGVFVTLANRMYKRKK